MDIALNTNYDNDLCILVLFLGTSQPNLSFTFANSDIMNNEPFVMNAIFKDDFPLDSKEFLYGSFNFIDEKIHIFKYIQWFQCEAQDNRKLKKKFSK